MCKAAQFHVEVLPPLCRPMSTVLETHSRCYLFSSVSALLMQRRFSRSHGRAPSEFGVKRAACGVDTDNDVTMQYGELRSSL